MDRSTFSAHLGANIRAARLRRGLSSEELADRLSAQGVLLSGRGVRNYEEGLRACSVELMVQLALALECSVQTLLDGLDPRLEAENVERSAVEYNILTPEEHEVFRYMATGWTGDRHALVLFTALYMALPPRYRREAPLSLLTQAELALQAGDVCREQLPDMMYIENHWRDLYK